MSKENLPRLRMILINIFIHTASSKSIDTDLFNSKNPLAFRYFSKLDSECWSRREQKN